MRTAMLILVCLPTLLFTTGCASYRYDAAVAGNDALAVRKDQDLVLPAGAVELRLRQVETRCVLLVVNRGPDAVSLDAAGSALVDPKGQSHAVAGQLIPPNSHAKFVLPPLRDTTPNGPSIGFGFGVLVEAPPAGERPAQYLAMAAPVSDFWEWNGEGVVRLTLAIRSGEKTETHNVVITRTKV